MFFGLIGTPMRNMALLNSLLALADPVPFTLANLMTNMLVMMSRFIRE